MGGKYPSFSFCSQKTVEKQAEASDGIMNFIHESCRCLQNFCKGDCTSKAESIQSDKQNKLFQKARRKPDFLHLNGIQDAEGKRKEVRNGGNGKRENNTARS